MTGMRNEDLLDIISLQQTLYEYCSELDVGADRIQEYFSAECVFQVNATIWRGQAGVRQHYDDDAQAVKALCKDGIKTVRHAMLNPRISIRADRSAIVETIFINFSSGGKGPFLNAASPTVVADARMTCRRDHDGRWLIHKFEGTPIFYGSDPYMNTVLQQM